MKTPNPNPKMQGWAESSVPAIKKAIIKKDERPQLGCWAPGNYLCMCASCNDIFVGDKRAKMCADCAYIP